MRTTKLVVGVLLAAIAGILVLLNFSAVDSKLACTGIMTTTDGARDAKVFLRVKQYRWWVGLWSASHGSVFLEIPTTTIEYFGHMKVIEDQVQIYKDSTSIRGHYSKLSHALALATSSGLFEGTCRTQTEP